MTREEIEKLLGIVDTMLCESVTEYVREKIHKKITEVCNLAIEALSAEQEIVRLNDVISALDRNPKRFITCYKETEVSTKYDAGIVIEDGGNFFIGYEMQGAQETFSIGQPVYDKDGNLMGYLGIGVFDNLNYATDGNVRIPVEHWTICLPTKYCEGGKKVFTYWQNKEKGADDGQRNSN